MLLEWFKDTQLSPRILLLDGGVSTYLEDLLATRNQVFQHRRLWSSSLLLEESGCNDIKKCHEDFTKAGSDILSSVTYQCYYGCPVVNDVKMAKMFERGIDLAKATTRKYAAASLGCYGASLADGSEYRGDYNLGEKSKTKIYNFHSQKLSTVINKNPDAIAFETIPNHEEVCTVAELLVNTNTFACASWISLGCRNGNQLNDGTEIVDVLESIRKIDPNASNIHAIGINCCKIEYIKELLETITEQMATKGPQRGIVFYPNKGEEWDAETSNWREETGCRSSSDFVDEIKNGIEIISTTWSKYKNFGRPKIIVGGCCRINPSTIAAMRIMVDTLNY